MVLEKIIYNLNIFLPYLPHENRNDSSILKSKVECFLPLKISWHLFLFYIPATCNEIAPERRMSTFLLLKCELGLF